MWLDEDQDKVAAWLELQRAICPRCGTAEDDWIDPDTKQYLEQPKWEAVPFRCHGCAEVEQAQQGVPGDQRGVRIVLMPASGEDDDDGE